MNGLDQTREMTNDLNLATTKDEVSDPGTSQIRDTGLKDNQKMEDTKIGATIQEVNQTNLKVVATNEIKTKSKNDRAKAYLNDVSWDLAKLEEKFTYVTSFNWNITDNVDTVLKTLSIPNDILVTAAQKSPFEVTQLWKCSSIKFRIVLKASPFYQGALVIGFAPLNTPVNMRRLINMGGLITTVSESHSMTFEVPFRFPVGYLQTPNEQLGTFAVVVLSPLKTGPSNPNFVSAAVYVSIEGSEFKLPEVVQTATHISQKFVNQNIWASLESGIAASIVNNINDPPSETNVTQLCAGAGTIGNPRISHFQDFPSDLVEIRKRYMPFKPFQFTVSPHSVFQFRIPISSFYKSAMSGLDKWFGLYRGSVNVRLDVGGYDKVECRVSIDMPTTMSPVVFSEGVHLFDEQQSALFTIPWVQPTFVGSDITTVYGSVKFQFINFDAAPREILVEPWLALGDDFHVGLFLGADDYFGYRHPLVVTEPSQVPIPYVQITPQSGIIEFIDRALDTTLPVVEKASELLSKLDAHPITYQPYPVQIRNKPYLIASDNVQYLERLVTTNHNGMSLPDDQCFGTSKKETGIYDLCRVKTLFNTLNWTSALTEGSELLSIPVCPLGLLSLPGDTINTLSAPFQYWNGSIEYVICVVASEMHRGQLKISFQPNSITNYSYLDASQTYFTTVDLADGKGNICIRVPYLSAFPYKQVPLETTPTQEHASGLLKIFVQNPLRSTATVSPDVQVMIFMRAGPDFNLQVYSKSNAFNTTA